jgi:capsular exopolysaccharide synthesis family protein
MGQIQDALNKAKSIHGGAATRVNDEGVDKEMQSGRSRNGPRQATEVESALSKAARKIALDVEAMERNRVYGFLNAQGIKSAYKMLRTRVLQQMRTNNWTRLALSSARPGEGKTLTAINMAISLAIEPNQNVILVDLDLRRPSIAQCLGMPPGPGLSEYLTGKASIDQIIVKPDLDRLLIVPNYQSIENSSELLTSRRMVELVDALSNRSNSTIVIFDLPPMLEADDMLAFSPYFDSLLMVVAQGETKRVDLQKSFELLNDIEVIGIVLNKSRSTEDAPGYY